MMDLCFIPCNNSWEKIFCVCSKHFEILFTKLLMTCFLLRSQHSWHPWGLTFDIIKTEWMILESVPAQMPSSWAITLTLTRRSCKIIVLHFLAHFLWRCFTGRSERESSSIDSLLKLLGPKLYLIVGSRNITICSIHSFMDLCSISSFPLWRILSRNEDPNPTCSL